MVGGAVFGGAAGAEDRGLGGGGGGYRGGGGGVAGARRLGVVGGGGGAFVVVRGAAVAVEVLPWVLEGDRGGAVPCAGVGGDRAAGGGAPADGRKRVVGRRD